MPFREMTLKTQMRRLRFMGRAMLWRGRRKPLAVGLIIVLAVMLVTLRLRKVQTPEDILAVLAGMIKEQGGLPHHPDKQSCIHPKLSPFGGELDNIFFPPVDPIKCSEEKDWIQIEKGIISISRSAQKKHGNIICNITFLLRENDMETIDGTTVTMQNNQKVNMQQDFFKANCSAADDVAYENIHAGVQYRPELHRRTRDTTSGLGLDVLMIGLDSLSHMTYIRTLPKTYKYFREKMGGIVLNGYNIVGDGTPQALIPILTGKTELELPSTLRRVKKPQPVDVFPMIWKDFRRHGYVTAWGEDVSPEGTFTYRMIGFNEQPTDHYMRPFYIEAEKHFNKHKKLCLGSKRRTQVFFDWLKHLYIMYENNSKFIFGFHSEISHGNNNLIKTGDEDMVDTLKFLHEAGYLNNTLVILMADHGARFSDHRGTLQGKQEERLPMFGFALPKWFKQKYPSAFTNLKTNGGRLTTPFDIHPTFRDLLTFTGSGMGDRKHRGISLFQEVPKSRTCADVSIEPHWCSCLNWISVSVSDDKVIKSAEHLVKRINGLVKPQEKLCSTLSLDKITWATAFLPDTDLLKFKQSSDADGRVPDLSDSTSVDSVLYQVGISTTPGGGNFEATVKYNVKAKTYHISTHEISRTNLYGTDPMCIFYTQQQLRKYCYCKENIKN